MKRNAEIREALGFDDVLLVPAETLVKPEDVVTRTRLTRDIELSIPVIAAGLDYVTESRMAVTIAQLGGIGVIHDNMPLGKQVEEVRRVKRAEGNVVASPITVSPESSVAEALDLMTTYRISGLPVIEQPSQKVIGIITNRDIRFFEDYAKPVSELMSKNVITVKSGIPQSEARQLMHQHRIEKLVVVDEDGRCAGLMTVKDIEKLSRYPLAARDVFGRLRVGASVSLGKDAVDRANAMADAGLDVVFVDVAHGHSREAFSTVSMIRQQRSSNVQVVAGNVATADAAMSLIDAGADAIKVGLGATACAASRRLAGVGMPQLTAVMNVAEQCELRGIPVIVDGGVLSSAHIAKAIAAGADSVMISNLFAGTDEAPGEIVYQDAQAYKVVNPLAKAQHRPTTTSLVRDPFRLDEDAVDTSVPYRGSVTHMVEQLVGGLKMSMAYTGSRDIEAMRENAELVKAK
ncbi:MAG TPA: IMP dehydrogenase [Alphaproteobacteria bacterium]|nr:IMP dehydrogenase [Rhodospirillaceae bacterium]HRJ67510.1 IMP dehydrogenase [Alphaproteobacteria bacterium]